MFFLHKKTLNNLLSFGIYLIDDSNNELTFLADEKKISILNFKIDVFSRWIEDLNQVGQTSKLRKNKSSFYSKTLKKSRRI